MSRRGFVKWLLAAGVMVFGGIWYWLQKLLESPSAPGAMAGTPTTAPAEPTAAPVPEKGALLASLFLFSDMHISPDNPPTTEKLHMALKDVTTMSEQKTDAIIFGGDLTDFGRDGDYKLLRTILNGYKLPPLYGNMGNHDYYHVWLDKNGQFSNATVPNGRTDEESRARFRTFMGIDKPYGDAWINGVHVILLSQETYVQEKPEVGEGAWYSDEQLAWLKTVMEPHKNGKPAIVFIHQPLPAVGSDGATHRLIRANEFRAILKPYKNVFVFSGHTHQNLRTGSHYSKESFHWFMNASVGRTRAGQGSTQIQSQGMLIQVFEGAVVIRGREFTDQSWIQEAHWDIPLEGV